MRLNINYANPFRILLPLGISFFILQTIGYLLDVYHGKREPEKNIGIFALYVSFFPLILSGPIERSTHFLPQLLNSNKINLKYENISRGVKLIIWGYFYKYVIADRSAIYVNTVYNNASNHSGISFILATVFYSFQIYCDFAGYSNIAIGSAKLFGFDILKNFNRPYFSKSIREFWSRWHITLSTWFRDYVYLPTAYSISRKLKREKYLNIRAEIYIYSISIIITYFICGLWHGPKWTFIAWGCLQAVYLSIESIFRIRSKRRFINIFLTYSLVCFAWIFFRANSIPDAIKIIIKIVTKPGKPFIPVGPDLGNLIYSIIFICLLILLECKKEYFDNIIQIFNNKNEYIRVLSYGILVAVIIYMGVMNGGQFIYVQF